MITQLTACNAYINKFKTLTAGIVKNKESERFLNDVQSLNVESELHKLNVETTLDYQKQKNSKVTIF